MPTPQSAQPAGAIETLLRDLGPRLRRGPAASENRLERCSTGLPDLDRLLGGGFPRGRLSEIAGPASSGRTSIAQALLAELTRSGSVVAVVDLADAFDPPSAKCVGVELRRVLWVRAPQLREALRSTERLLQASGFALVLLDLAVRDPRVALSGRSRATAPIVPLSSWLRLGRAAAASRTALVVLSQRRCTGTAADLAVEMAPTHSRFTGNPALFEGLTVRVTPVRSRSGAGEPSPCAPPAY
jgi:RecA/RadA recombinase